MRKQEKFGLWRRAAREVIYALFIGALPLLISTSPEEVSALVTALLAAPELMAYYVYLLIAFAIVSVFTLRVTFRSLHLIGKSREVHAFFVNVGGSLLTACRAALGAMIGYLGVWCYRAVEDVSAGGVYAVVSYASLTLMFCIGLAWTDETLRDPHAVSSYR